MKIAKYILCISSDPRQTDPWVKIGDIHHFAAYFRPCFPNGPYLYRQTIRSLFLGVHDDRDLFARAKCIDYDGRAVNLVTPAEGSRYVRDVIPQVPSRYGWLGPEAPSAYLSPRTISLFFLLPLQVLLSRQWCQLQNIHGYLSVERWL